MDNLVNEPLPAASISKDNARGWEKETFKCDIIILWLFFYISNMLGEKKRKNKQEVSARANDVNKHFDWLIFLLKVWLDQGLTGCYVKWTLATPHR